LQERALANELIYEVLKQVQGDLPGLKQGQTEIRQELNAIRLAQLSMQIDIHNIYGVLARHDERHDRIERRLELREFAETQHPFDPGS
jgi:hypothetical protein